MAALQSLGFFDLADMGLSMLRPYVVTHSLTEIKTG
jgi:hypothetical protein